MATQSSILTGKVQGQRCLAGYSPWGCRESDTTVQLSGGVCNFLSSVSPQQKFETVDQCYSSVTAQFYLASKGNHILKAWGWADPEEEGGSILAPLFKCFSPSPEPALRKLGLARGTVCFSWGSQTFLCSISVGFFLSFSFSHCYFGLLVPILTT